MKFLSITKKGVEKKLDYFLKSNNISLSLLVKLNKKQVYKLFKMINLQNDNSLTKKSIKVFVKKINEYLETKKHCEEVLDFIGVPFKENIKLVFVDIRETIVSFFIIYFFNKKQILRY